MSDRLTIILGIIALLVILTIGVVAMKGSSQGNPNRDKTLLYDDYVRKHNISR